MLRASWSLDVEHEFRAVTGYVWSKRPIVFRWPYLLALFAFGVIASVVTFTTDGALRSFWIVVAIVLGVLVVGLLVLRELVRRTIAMAVSATDHVTGAPCTVVLDDEGWHETYDNATVNIAWREGDTWAIHDGMVIVVTPRKKMWIPGRLVVTPLQAFGESAFDVVPFLEAHGVQPDRRR